MFNYHKQNTNRHQWISVAAYFKAEDRNFAPGKELDDWLEAEITYAEMLITDYVAMLAEDGPIRVVDLQQLVTLIGIDNTGHLVSETELVREIQKTTKHRPCFRSTFNKQCEEQECKWKTECKKLVSVWYL